MLRWRTSTQIGVVVSRSCGVSPCWGRQRVPDVPWRATAALRNRIVHSYWQISTSILLATAQDDIPPLLESVRAVQRTLDDAGDR